MSIEPLNPTILSSEMIKFQLESPKPGVLWYAKGTGERMPYRSYGLSSQRFSDTTMPVSPFLMM